MNTITPSSGSNPTPEPTRLPAPQAQHSRRWLKPTLLVAGVGVAVLVGSAALDLALESTTHSTKVVDQAVTTIDIDVDGGDVEIIGTDGDNITIDTARHGGFAKPDQSETVHGDTLVVRSDCGWNLISLTCGADIVIHVPRDVAVIARGDGTDYDVTGLDGEIDIRLSGGDADLGYDAAPARIDAHTDGGDITVVVPNDTVAYRVDAHSSGGSTHVDVRTDPASTRVIDAGSDGGDIIVRYGDVSN